MLILPYRLCVVLVALAAGLLFSLGVMFALVSEPSDVVDFVTAGKVRWTHDSAAVQLAFIVGCLAGGAAALVGARAAGVLSRRSLACLAGLFPGLLFAYLVCIGLIVAAWHPKFW